MNLKYLKISTLIILCSLMCFSFILGCKSTQLPNGPYDVPTVTATATNTATPTNSPTPTATLGPVNVSCYVNYGGSSQNGVSWNLVDPNGNTINTTWPDETLKADDKPLVIIETGTSKFPE